MSAGNKKIINIKNTIILTAIFGVLFLSFKGYYFFSNKKEKNSTVIAENNAALSTNNSNIRYKQDEAEGKYDNNLKKDYTYDAEKVSDILNNKAERDGKKIVFLTFDDGPSTTITPKILDILKQYDVKATFMLVGKNVESNEESKKLVKRILEEGHEIGNHTYSHDYKNKLYPKNKLNVDYFMEEIQKTDNAIKSIVGESFNTRVIRMPGGYMSRKIYNDPNLDIFDSRLKEKNIISIDWNAYAEDAETKKRNAEQILEAVKKTVGTKEKVVLLMHDTYGKEETAKALPNIIEYLKNQGYEFKTIK